MIETITLLDAAKADLAEATWWYREQQPGLEAGFHLCVEQTLDRIARHPQAYHYLYSEFRRAVVHRFPYAVIYRIARGQVFVTAILHTSRDPKIWRRRGH